MSRTVYRLFAPSLTRVNVHVAARSALTRRMMSSESHSAHGSSQSDRPWMVGSALIFGPLFLYLVSPSARKGTHVHPDNAHNNHHGEQKDDDKQPVESKHEEEVKPIADDEGTRASGQEIKESMQKAFASDSPKDAQEQEEVVAKAEMTTVAKAVESYPQESSSPDSTLISESPANAAPAAPIGVDDVAKEESAGSDANVPVPESKV